MVKIRLSRVGRTNFPRYRIIVVDSRERRDGRYLERIGHYDPHQTEPSKKLSVDVERVRFWLSKGAQTSEKLGRLLKHTAALTEEAKAEKKRKPRKKKAAKAKKKTAKAKK